MGTKKIIDSVVSQLELGSIEDEFEKSKIELEVLEKQQKEDTDALIEAENSLDLAEQRFSAKKRYLMTLAQEREEEHKEISDNVLIECQLEMTKASKNYSSVKDNPFRSKKAKEKMKVELVEKNDAYNSQVQNHTNLINQMNYDKRAFEKAKCEEDLNGIILLFTSSELKVLVKLMTEVATAKEDVNKQKFALENTNKKIKELKHKIEELDKKIEETKEERKVYQGKVQDAKNATAKKAANVVLAASTGFGVAIGKGKELYSKAKDVAQAVKETANIQEEIEDENNEQPFAAEEVQQKTEEKDSQVNDVAEKIINGATKGASVVLEKGKGLLNAAKADISDALDYIEETLEESETEDKDDPTYVDNDQEEKFKNTTSYLKEEGRKLVDEAKGFFKRYK